LEAPVRSGKLKSKTSADRLGIPTDRLAAGADGPLAWLLTGFVRTGAIVLVLADIQSKIIVLGIAPTGPDCIFKLAMCSNRGFTCQTLHQSTAFAFEHLRNSFTGIP
jgi:hypothetical protein